MSVRVPQLRLRLTPFMADQIHKIALREARSEMSVINTLVTEAIYARMSPSAHPAHRLFPASNVVRLKSD